MALNAPSPTANPFDPGAVTIPYADPNFDTGLLDPWPSTVKRPSYAAWAGFPRFY